MRPRHPARVAGLAALTAALTAAPLATPAHAVTGTPDADNALAFTVRLDIGQGARACSAALVDREWLLTAASCFADDPAASPAVPAGKPKLKTVATIGRADLTSTAGGTRTVLQLVPHPSRDLVLGRLSSPVRNTAPVALSSTPPVAGEELTVAGYGRTEDAWSPLLRHSGRFTVDAVNAGAIDITGRDGAAVCMGDTGGPAVRTTGGQAELVAVNSRSWQGGCFGVDPAETRTGAVDARVDDLRDWVAAAVGAPRLTDFNCDGVEDIAIGDPKAAVGGDKNAGLIRVIYGGGKGTAELHQDLDAIPGGAEAEDWYGRTLDVFDHDNDGCTDLAVGIPNEDIGSKKDAGAVHVVYGDPAGLAKGRSTLDLVQGKGSGAIAASASEAGDRFGHSLAAGHTAASEPYLLIGIPGEDLGSVTDAGSAIYLRGNVNTAVHQDKPGVGGGAEAGDKFGSSVAASPNHLAVGAPGEAVGKVADAGLVAVFRHAISSDGIPSHLKSVHQDTAGVSGVPEKGDRFGASLDLAEYRPAGAASATDSLIAVGTPGEGIVNKDANRDNAGSVIVLRAAADGALSQHMVAHQEVEGVSGAAETDDKFGDKVLLVNTSPREVSTDSTMALAVGVPGEDLGSVVNAGAVQTFGLFGPAGETDVWAEAGNASGLPGAPGEGQVVGRYIQATGTHLYVGMPYKAYQYGAVHVLPWGNVTAGRLGEAGDAVTHQPGRDGLPAAGVAFGRAIG
ncbi:S1 family peptidase [Streptomyces sp. MUM 178J]|uniref:S1 family peptidase n=1 Tax=Streptomyces sp. MUM 178J TaxID=2791991 RepID=UPI001F0361FA|nr:S1 family peptidase [Streptomyces sp. MUM 178J]WRQ82391.1 S1 family peptidase [Streptomyces sp. MUM 178J]